MTPDEFDEIDQLAGEYVLGTLSRSEAARVTGRAKSEPVLAARVAYWEQRLLPLTHTVAPMTPSSGLWRRIKRKLGKTDSLPKRLWGSVVVWRSLSLVAFSLAVVASSVAIRQQFYTPTQLRFVVVLSEPKRLAADWLVQVSDDRKLRLIPLTDSQPATNTSLQLWTKADGWKAPISLGLITPGKTIEISLDHLPQLVNNQLFEITLEPYNGSPVGRPTGRILAIGRAVSTL